MLYYTISMKAILILLVLLTLGSAHEGIYSEPLSARMAQLSTVIYAINSTEYQTNRCSLCYSNFTSIKQLIGDHILTMVGVDRGISSIIVVFRGSSNLRNWITDEKFIHKAQYEDPNCYACHVHAGFYYSYKKLL